MKVATAQFMPLFKGWDENLATCLELVKKAAAEGAHLIVLPELCLTGYSFMSTDEALPFSEVLSGESTRKGHAGDKPRSSRTAMQAWSTEWGIAIAWGIVEEDPGTGELFNSQVLVLPDGRWTKVQKLNLWGNDWIWAQPGKASPPILTYMGKRIGLLICADIRDASDKIEDFYEPGDADIVAYSANWGNGGFPAGKWVKFAKGNNTTLIVSNRYGRETCNDFGEGGICVIAPSGKILCEGLVWSAPCIVYAEVP